MTNRRFQVVCFGEVLWDILPSGKEPGGAPMNVAYHLNRHSIDTTLITCIGNDEDGMQIKQLFHDRNISTDLFATDPEHETGKVYATILPGNEMSYDIAWPAAWDFIRYETSLKETADEATYFVYGSLAARSEVSRTTLLKLLETSAIKVFDINLRPPHYTKEVLMDLLERADILKLNEHELDVIGSWYEPADSREDVIRLIADRLNIRTIIVTLGSAGAVLFNNDEFFHHAGYKVKVVDTVGSGDAFLAAMLAGFIHGKNNATALDDACRLGAFVATQKGGCPAYEMEDIGQQILNDKT